MTNSSNSNNSSNPFLNQSNRSSGVNSWSKDSYLKKGSEFDGQLALAAVVANAMTSKTDQGLPLKPERQNAAGKSAVLRGQKPLSPEELELKKAAAQKSQGLLDKKLGDVSSADEQQKMVKSHEETKEVKFSTSQRRSELADKSTSSGQESQKKPDEESKINQRRVDPEIAYQGYKKFVGQIANLNTTDFSEFEDKVNEALEEYQTVMGFEERDRFRLVDLLFNEYLGQGYNDYPLRDLRADQLILKDREGKVLLPLEIGYLSFNHNYNGGRSLSQRGFFWSLTLDSPVSILTTEDEKKLLCILLSLHLIMTNMAPEEIGIMQSLKTHFRN